MDINFHYFAVKTIAVHAGFDDTDAQIIAAYSQFVDDFTMINNCYFRKGVPSYAEHLVQEGLLYNTFVTITTGFDNWLEMARLVIWKYQRQVCVPFHFIPTCKVSSNLSEGNDTSDYKTHAATLKSGFLINSLLDNAKKQCADADTQGAEAKKVALMRVGMLLHIFADTYAHDTFSGFRGWENYGYIQSVSRVYDRKDITGNYNRDVVAEAPAIGHANVSHAPDDTFAYINIKRANSKNETDKSKYSRSQSRSNHSHFMAAAKEIYKYLLGLMSIEYDEGKWEALCAILSDGFYLEAKDVIKLSEGWHQICSNITYSYNKADYGDKLLHGFFGEEPAAEADTTDSENVQALPGLLFYDYADDDFFRYNVLAKEIRDAVIGAEL